MTCDQFLNISFQLAIIETFSARAAWNFKGLTSARATASDHGPPHPKTSSDDGSFAASSNVSREYTFSRFLESSSEISYSLTSLYLGEPGPGNNQSRSYSDIESKLRIISMRRNPRESILLVRVDDRVRAKWKASRIADSRQLRLRTMGHGMMDGGVLARS
jgi:hypothetical protein